MKRLWKQFEELVTALKSSFAVDIFTEARFKIAFLFFVMGIIILGVAGYFTYTHGLTIVQDVIFWLVVVLVISAYILAGAALYPVRKAMDKQRQFIAHVAHELRTPLSVMRTETEVALLNAMASSRNELLATVKSNLEEIDHMTKIIQFLLDFSHLESRLSTLELYRVDLAAVTMKAVTFMENPAAGKQIILQVLPLAPIVILKGNETALEEMIVNLLKNAINYTPPGGSVMVGLMQTAYHGAVLTVQDTGVGIAEDDISRLFEPFYRGENVRAMKDTHGTGLGLAIVKEIAKLHRATISIKSTVGKGTTVAIRFSPFTVRRVE